MTLNKLSIVTAALLAVVTVLALTGLPAFAIVVILVCAGCLVGCTAGGVRRG